MLAFNVILNLHTVIFNKKNLLLQSYHQKTTYFKENYVWQYMFELIHVYLCTCRFPDNFLFFHLRIQVSQLMKS